MGWCILEAVQAATGVNFDLEDAAKQRLRFPTRMKGGGIKSTKATRYPAFLGALPDVLPRCIDMTEINGDKINDRYNKNNRHQRNGVRNDTQGSGTDNVGGRTGLRSREHVSPAKITAHATIEVWSGLFAHAGCQTKPR